MSFSDNFTNAGAQQALGSRSGWEFLTGGDGSECYVPAAGSNLHCNPSFNIAFRCTDQGSANHVTSAAWRGSSTGFVCVRLTDRDNFIGFRHDGTSWQVYKRVAGTFTQLGTDYTVSLTSGDIGELTADGDTITFTVNGVARCLGAGVTETFNNTVTRQGVVARSTATPWIDDFFADAVGAAPTLTGSITLADLEPTGTLGLNPSTLTGSITLDAIAPTGTLGIAPGSVTTFPFSRNTGSRPTGLTGVALAILSDDANLTRLAGATSIAQDGAGRLTYTGAGLPSVGTSVLVVTREPDGKLGLERYTVA